MWWDHTTPERKEFYIGMGVNLGRKSGVASGTFVWLRGWERSNRGRIAAVVFDPHPINLVLSYIHIFAPLPSDQIIIFNFCISLFSLNLKQALQYRIWDLGLNPKNPYKGKIQAFGAKLGLFWDQSFLGLLVVIFMKMQKTCKKGNTRVVTTFPISKCI